MKGTLWHQDAPSSLPARHIPPAGFLLPPKLSQHLIENLRRPGSDYSQACKPPWVWKGQSGVSYPGYWNCSPRLGTRSGHCVTRYVQLWYLSAVQRLHLAQSLFLFLYYMWLKKLGSEQYMERSCSNHSRAVLGHGHHPSEHIHCTTFQEKYWRVNHLKFYFIFFRIDNLLEEQVMGGEKYCRETVFLVRHSPSQL